MAGVELQQANYFPGDEFPHSTLCQPYNHALQNTWNTGVLPAAVVDQRHNHWEDAPQPIGDVDVTRQDRPRNPSHINTAYHGTTDYYPRPLGNPHALPGVGLVQEVPAQALPNVTSENQDHATLDHGPHSDAPDPGMVAFPDPFAYQPPAPDRPATENLRQLAIRYLRDPDSQVKLVCMEPGADGNCKVVITVEIADVL